MVQRWRAEKMLLARQLSCSRACAVCRVGIKCLPRTCQRSNLAVLTPCHCFCLVCVLCRGLCACCVCPARPSRSSSVGRQRQPQGLTACGRLPGKAAAVQAGQGKAAEGQGRRQGSHATSSSSGSDAATSRTATPTAPAPAPKETCGLFPTRRWSRSHG